MAALLSLSQLAWQIRYQQQKLHTMMLHNQAIELETGLQKWTRVSPINCLVFARLSLGVIQPPYRGTIQSLITDPSSCLSHSQAPCIKVYNSLETVAHGQQAL